MTLEDLKYYLAQQGVEMTLGVYPNSIVINVDYDHNTINELEIRSLIKANMISYTLENVEHLDYSFDNKQYISTFYYFKKN